MFKLVVPCTPKLEKLEKLIDNLIQEPYIEINDVGISRMIGFHLSPLRKRNILSLYYEREQGGSLAKLNNKNVTKKYIYGNNSIEYDFNVEIPNPKKKKLPWIF